MIGTIRKLFEPSKAHKYGLDYVGEAAAIYRRIADDLRLEIVMEPNANVELSMWFPKQNGIGEPVWVCLQNLDELWFCVEDFTCSMFPFEEVKDEFEETLRAFLGGQCRIRKFARRSDGKVFRSFLQERVADEWITIYRYGKILGLLPTLTYDVRDEYPIAARTA